MATQKVHLYYEDIYIDTLSANHDLTIEEMLDIVEFDEESFLKQYNMDMLDYNDFTTGGKPSETLKGEGKR